MAAMKKSALLLIVFWALTAPASAAFLGGNSRLGESLLDAGSRHVGGELSREGLPDSGEAWLRRVAECFVAPGASPIIVTPKGVAVASETLAKQGASHLAGNFTGLAGKSVDDIVAGVPSKWRMVPQDKGMGIKLLDEAGFERIRIHGPSPKAPAGSNSASGWTMRIMDRAGNYYDDAGRIVPYKANSGHIPIYGNPKSP